MRTAVVIRIERLRTASERARVWVCLVQLALHEGERDRGTHQREHDRQALGGPGSHGGESLREAAASRR